MNNKLQIADKTFSSRLFTGTGKFSSSKLMKAALLASESELVTVALKRVDVQDREDDILSHLIILELIYYPIHLVCEMQKKPFLQHNYLVKH